MRDKIARLVCRLRGHAPLWTSGPVTVQGKVVVITGCPRCKAAVSARRGTRAERRRQRFGR